MDGDILFPHHTIDWVTASRSPQRCMSIQKWQLPSPVPVQKDCFSIMHSGFVASTVSKNQYAVCQTAFAWRSRAAFEDGCETVYDKAYVILAWICFALLYVSVGCANVSKWCAVVHSYSLELFHLYWKYILPVSWQALSLNIKLETKDTFVEFQLRQYCIIWMIIDITYVYFCIEETWQRVSALAVC